MEYKKKIVLEADPLSDTVLNDLSCIVFVVNKCK